MGRASSSSRTAGSSADAGLSRPHGVSSIVLRSAALAASLALFAGCGREPAPKRYEITGQLLAVLSDPPRLTIKHEDIEGFMPGMTMTFDVTPKSVMDGRTVGELVRGTLEVTDSRGVIVALTHTGTAPLPPASAADAMAAGILQPGDPLPDTAFIDQNDRRRALSEWKGALTLVTFIYTRCPLPNFCPLMDQYFSTIQRAAAEDRSLRGRVKLISVTFDPEFDTPAVLRAHAQTRRADPAVWTFLTGDRVTLERFAAKFGVGVIRTPPASTAITHNLRTVMVGADGRILRIYSGNDWTPSTVLADLRNAARRP
jgi:protein SCO1/2